ncbi:hypothetical protein FACS1894105_00170 [Clostridia bacterium]|nr:hypothetical protein FACS1894105_00170 [Clostridia bacterium]
MEYSSFTLNPPDFLDYIDVPFTMMSTSSGYAARILDNADRVAWNQILRAVRLIFTKSESSVSQLIHNYV